MGKSNRFTQQPLSKTFGKFNPKSDEKVVNRQLSQRGTKRESSGDEEKGMTIHGQTFEEMSQEVST